MSTLSGQVSYKQLSAFFIPLGISASLTAITHVIINGTLARGENAAFIIACYAVAFALFGIIERPIIVFRQTSSALVKDLKSFKLLNLFLLYVMLGIMIFSWMMAFSPFGDWIYVQFFHADPDMVHTISQAFKVITLVLVFSGIRGIYQGIIINHLETKWLTIGVIARLVTMFACAYLFVALDYVTSTVGSIIFLAGMMIECVISVWKGHFLVKDYPKNDKSTTLRKKDIAKFYTPLVFYFLIQTIMIPIIYIFLAKTEQLQMGIASFALAFSITNMILSFFMYTHQIVMQFYQKNKKRVVKFTLTISFIPSLVLILLCYSPLGLWFMQGVMGADAVLATTTLGVLKFFILKTLVFPIVDFLNGFLMLQRRTSLMVISQIANLAIVIGSLILLVHFYPHWNGINGAIAASLGELAGLIVVSWIVLKLSRHNHEHSSPMTLKALISRKKYLKDSIS
ncbi:multi antimicrobial extrusion protein MatE [Bacillus sp. PS06]|uniref:multi antimicrobial extrusion protein MatE n=1 Tax=Bacillus sp. PS06 TaxID=2764176 RepID=UPI001786C039|nr:multi antimicrobial extrusion protein MatE [Bacillus sp. PS06]MBD8071146.1 multi antimicrobial extrusion protein MatE [Bacillus sp. PS06]